MPWRKLDLGVRISLSCQAYNDVRSKLGLFKITKWETLPPTREKDHAQIKDGPDPWPEKSALESAQKPTTRKRIYWPVTDGGTGDDPVVSDQEGVD